VLTVDVAFYISPFGGWRRIEGSHTLPRQMKRMLDMDKVAGVIDVSLTDNTHEVVISYPDSRPNANGVHEIVIMPRYARHLAQVLIEYAAAAEAKTNRRVTHRENT
jgi:NACalpha-BTF3-like transcription factor